MATVQWGIGMDSQGTLVARFAASGSESWQSEPKHLLAASDLPQMFPCTETCCPPLPLTPFWQTRNEQVMGSIPGEAGVEGACS